MNEKALTLKILKRLRNLPYSWWYKIPDPAVCPRCGTFAVASRRPFDIVGSLFGKFVAIEVKTKSISDLETHQDGILKLIGAMKGHAVVIVGEDEFYFHNGAFWNKYEFMGKRANAVELLRIFVDKPKLT